MMDRPGFTSRVTFSQKLVRAVNHDTGERVWDTRKLNGEGVYIGWRTLSDGVVKYVPYDDGLYFDHEWRAARYFEAWLVVQDERKSPIYVLPEDCKVIPEDDDE